MNLTIHECEQRSPEWFALHAGVITASNFDKIITPTGLESRSVATYLYQLVGEWLLGKPEDGYVSDAMIHGMETEPEARMSYEMNTGEIVKEVGFITTMEGAVGCSPDGLIGDSGALEIKCPKIGTHVKTLLSKKIPDRYIPQVQGSLWITGREWWDWMSHYRGLPDIIIRAFPNPSYFGRLDELVPKAVMTLDAMKNELKRYKRKDEEND